MNSNNRAPESKSAKIFMYFWIFMTCVMALFGLLFLILNPIGGIFFVAFDIFMMCFGVKSLTFFINKRDRLYNICQNPSEQAAKEYLEYCRQNKPKLYTEANHPNNWNKLRDYWYKINGSNKIPTYLKAEILESLKKDGLYVKETIVDNYNQ